MIDSGVTSNRLVFSVYRALTKPPNNKYNKWLKVLSTQWCSSLFVVTPNAASIVSN